MRVFPYWRYLVLSLLLISGIYCLPARGSDDSFSTRAEISGKNLVQEELKIFSFAVQLYRQKEYYRAIGELMRLTAYYPQSPLAEPVQFLTAESYFLAEKWDQAIEQYEKFLQLYPRSPLVEDAEYKIVLTYYSAGNFIPLKNMSEPLQAKTVKHRWDDELTYLNYLVLVEEKEWTQALDFINTQLKENNLSKYLARYRALSPEIVQYKNIPVRDPRLAGLFSAVIPGSGQLYTKRPGDGLIAFILTTVFVAAAV